MEIASGNTGVVNFTEMLKAIHDVKQKDEPSKWKYRTLADYNADGTPKSDDETTWSGTISNGEKDPLKHGYKIVPGYNASNPFDPYILRDNDKNPVIYGNNCDHGVCFKGNQVILGTKANGLGVFTIVTRAEDNEGDNWINGLNKFNLRAVNYNDDTTFTDFYYTTAECQKPAAVNKWLPTLQSTSDVTDSGEFIYSQEDLKNNCYFYRLLLTEERKMARDGILRRTIFQKYPVPSILRRIPIYKNILRYADLFGRNEYPSH